jgi:hypothetical protein
VWFCSFEGFGEVTKVLTINIYPISQGNIESEIFAYYYLEDNIKGNKCYKQNIVVKKYSLDNKKIQWMISNMENRETPYDCELNN